MSVVAHVPNPKRKKITVCVWFLLLFLSLRRDENVLVGNTAFTFNGHNHQQTSAMCENCTSHFPLGHSVLIYEQEFTLVYRLFIFLLIPLEIPPSFGFSVCPPSLIVVDDCMPSVMHVQFILDVVSKQLSQKKMQV